MALSFANLLKHPDAWDLGERQRVELPELGEVDSGKVGSNDSPIFETAWAWVRPLTVRDKSILSSHAVSLGGAAEHSAMCVIAALGTVDDAGRLTFGKTRSQAIETVANLPEKYVPMVARLSHAVLKVTGMAADTDGDGDGAVSSKNGHDLAAEKVEEAEKN